MTLNVQYFDEEGNLFSQHTIASERKAKMYGQFLGASGMKFANSDGTARFFMAAGPIGLYHRCSEKVFGDCYNLDRECHVVSP